MKKDFGDQLVDLKAEILKAVVSQSPTPDVVIMALMEVLAVSIASFPEDVREQTIDTFSPMLGLLVNREVRKIDSRIRTHAHPSPKSVS